MIISAIMPFFRTTIADENLEPKFVTGDKNRNHKNIGEFLWKCQMPDQQTARDDGWDQVVVGRSPFLVGLLLLYLQTFHSALSTPSNSPTAVAAPNASVWTGLVCWFSVIIVQLHFQFVKMCNLISFDNYVSLSRCCQPGLAGAEGASLRLGNWASHVVAVGDLRLQRGGDPEMESLHPTHFRNALNLGDFRRCN